MPLRSGNLTILNGFSLWIWPCLLWGTLLDCTVLYPRWSHASGCIARNGVLLCSSQDVPYEPYTSWEGNLTVVSPKARYEERPDFEAVYAHYDDIRQLNASWTKAFRDYMNGTTP